MRTCLLTLGAVLALALAPTFARAQVPFYTYGSWTTPSPYYVPGPVRYTATYSSPSGYRSSYAAGVYNTPWGSNSYSSYYTQVRPFYTGPAHSIYWDPITLSYRHGPGRNTPNYSYRFYYGY